MVQFSFAFQAIAREDWDFTGQVEGRILENIEGSGLVQSIMTGKEYIYHNDKGNEKEDQE